MRQKNYYKNRAKIAKALAHPSRLLMLDALAKKDLCVCELTEFVGADQTTVSKHLAVLKNIGLVEDRKDGLNVIYSLKVPCILNFFSCAESVIKSNIKSGSR